MRRYSLLLLMVCLGLVAWADKWKVVEDEVTVWDSPECTYEMGHLQKDKVINVQQVVGDWLMISYLGDDACVNKDACVEYVEATPAEKTEPKVIGKTNDSQEVAAIQEESADVQQPSYSEKLGDIPENLKWLLVIAIPIVIVIFVLYVMAFVFLIFYVFMYDKLRRWFDRRCGMEIIPKSRINSVLKMMMGVALMSLVPYLILRFGTDWISNAMIKGTVQIVLMILMLFVPFVRLKREYRRYSVAFGKKAAKWIIIYGMLSLFAVYVTAVLALSIVCLLFIAYCGTWILSQGSADSALNIHNLHCDTCTNYGTGSCPYPNKANPSGRCSSYSY